VGELFPEIVLKSSYGQEFQDAGVLLAKYRKMNKTQLLIEIVDAYKSTPAFSQ
jgi:hypothetical protein